MTDIPIIVTTAGMQPTPPATINAQIIASVAAADPDYTANLPGILIEDISSTETAGVVQINSALVETINSLNPFAANAFLLTQLGNIYGVPFGLGSNTSVLVQFTGSIGFVIGQGFIVSDGTYQYLVQSGGVIASSGSSGPLLAIANQTGSWSIAAFTVNQLVSSVPIGVVLSVTNPNTGTPGAGTETMADYQSRVLQAGLASAQGMPTLLRTLLANVPGVQTRFISILQGPAGSGWEVICSGGDPYLTAFAIYQAMGPGIAQLVGSSLQVTGISNSNPGIVTTNLNHGYASGQVVTITGILGALGVVLNGVPLTITVQNNTQFSIGVDTTLSGTWVGGGVVTPNFRNITVSINDYPNTYQIVFVNSPMQMVTVSVTWNTISGNLVSNVAVSQLAAPAIVSYINSITAGQPINLFVLQETFQLSVASILPAALLTRMIFAVTINGVTTPPEPGTGIIPSDPESFFEITQAGVSINQG